MADKTVRYTPEFKRQMVELVRSGTNAGGAVPGVRADGLDDRDCGSSRTLAIAARATAA